MSRTLLALLAGTAIMFAPSPVEAQRQGAPISQGVTSGDLANTVDLLRRSNAEAQTRIAELEAEKAQMTGRIETLEFLLSENSDELNRLQVDIQEVGKRFAEYDEKIAELERDLQTALEGGPSQYTSVRRSDGSTGATSTGTVTRRIITPSTDEGSTTNSEPGEGTSTTTSTTTRRVLTPPEGSLGTIRASQLPGEAGPLFAEAKSRLLRFDYAGAQTAFQAFLDQFGEDAQAGEARYWLGEVLYQQGEYEQSGAAFTQMLRNHPDDARAPEALVKLARSLRLVGENEKACIALNTLPKRYPDASAVTQNFANVERLRSNCDA
jgi:tol-pal system protein YbgF